jgi:hypothetical protein
MVLQLSASVPHDGVFFAGEIFTCAITFSHIVPPADETAESDADSCFSNTPNIPSIENVYKNSPDKAKGKWPHRRSSSLQASSKPVPVTHARQTSEGPTTTLNKLDKIVGDKLSISTYSTLRGIAGTLFSATAANTPSFFSATTATAIAPSPHTLARRLSEADEIEIQLRDGSKLPSKLKINGTDRMRYQSPSASCEFPQIEQYSSTQELFVKNVASEAHSFIQNSRNLMGSTRMLPNLTEDFSPSEGALDGRANDVGIRKTQSSNNLTEKSDLRRIEAQSTGTVLRKETSLEDMGAPKLEKLSKSTSELFVTDTEQRSIEKLNTATSGGKLEVTSSVPNLIQKSRHLEHATGSRGSSESIEVTEENDSTTSPEPIRRKPPLAPLQTKVLQADTSGNEKMAWVFAQVTYNSYTDGWPVNSGCQLRP